MTVHVHGTGYIAVLYCSPDAIPGMVSGAQRANGTAILARGPRSVGDRPPTVWEPDLSNQPSSGPMDVVVVVHMQLGWPGMDLSWLKQQPYDYVLIGRGFPATMPNTLPRNHGNEASSYLLFILEHWDHLPEVMVFTQPLRKWNGPYAVSARTVLATLLRHWNSTITL